MALTACSGDDDATAARRPSSSSTSSTPGARTTTGYAQPGEAFGLDKARWDAWILLGPRGFDGGAIDLLELIESPQ